MSRSAAPVPLTLKTFSAVQAHRLTTNYSGQLGSLYLGGKLLTPMCLYHQAVQVGTGQRVVMPCGWGVIVVAREVQGVQVRHPQGDEKNFF